MTTPATTPMPEDAPTTQDGAPQPDAAIALPDQPQPDAAPPLPDTADADGSDDERPDDKIGREAARYRLRLRESEAALASLQGEHDQTRATLDGQRQAVVDAVITSAGYDARVAKLFAAEGMTFDSFVTADGLVDIAKVAEAVTAVTAQYGLQRQPRSPRPQPQQGSHPSSSTANTATWASLFGSATRGR